MPLRQNRYGWIFWALAGLSAFLGCMQDPGEVYYLRLTLNDSLSPNPTPPRLGYDSVEIVLVSASDTSKVLDTVFSGPLIDPKRLNSYPLPSGIKPGDFEVRVRAFKYDGQLALQTNIRKAGDSLVVVHSPINAPTPYSVRLNDVKILNPDGLLVPRFNPDTLDYEGLVALNVDSAEIYPTAEDGARAVIFIDSVPWIPGVNIPISLTPRRYELMVSNNGKQRIYHITLKKDSRGGPHLTAFKTFPQTWSPSFKPDSLTYSMSVPYTDTVLRFDSLLAEPSVLLILDNRDTVTAESLLAGFLPAPLPLQSGNNSFTINLSLFNSLTQVYTLNVYREYPPQLLKFKTDDKAIYDTTCPFCGNFWSPAFQPAWPTYLQSSVGLPRIYFDTLEVAPGYTAEYSFNSTINYSPIPPGTLPSPITLTGGTDIIRIRILKTGIPTSSIYVFTLAP